MTDYAFRYVTFLSDYGLTDDFVGVCHGVIARTAPEARVIDITHGIKPQDVLEGAMVLAQSVQYMPTAVHLAVVDPGVGSDRLPVIISTKDGSLLVGPDNGLLILAADRLGGARSCQKIENPAYMLPAVSKSFHGRDVFAPAAAHLALGVAPAEFGGELPLEELVRLTIPEARRHDDHYHAMVLHVDRFGNLQLNVTPKELADLGLTPGSLLEARVEGHRSMVAYESAYSAVTVGDLVVTEDSYGLLAVAVNRGNAAERLGAVLGSSVIIGPPGSGAGD
jgi:S-adenosyl-L-methionine hydrolase (adenosine-forming)